MPEYKTPGVYIEEIPKLPPSIASVDTAIPVFIGYTEKAQWKVADDLIKKPWRIKSLLEYEQYFGYADPEKESLSVAFTNGGAEVNGKIDETKRSKFLMYYSLQMFFANGGGPCWIISVGNYTSTGGSIVAPQLKEGLAEAAKVNEITLILFPDAINLDSVTDYYDVYGEAIDQAAELQDRFVILDVYHVPANAERWLEDINTLRSSALGSGTDELKYAAVYFPRIYVGIDYSYRKPGSLTDDNDEIIKIEGIAGAETLADLKKGKNAQYYQAKSAIRNIQMLLPASSAMAGIYALVDNTRGVWKAPANVNIDNAIGPEFLITHKDQRELNVDPQDGKSINVIRKFEGRGPAIVWGARTLAGNSNEWRYISVRRYFNMVEDRKSVV